MHYVEKYCTLIGERLTYRHVKNSILEMERGKPLAQITIRDHVNESLKSGTTPYEIGYVLHRMMREGLITFKAKEQRINYWVIPRRESNVTKKN